MKLQVNKASAPAWLADPRPVGTKYIMVVMPKVTYRTAKLTMQWTLEEVTLDQI